MEVSFDRTNEEYIINVLNDLIPELPSLLTQLETRIEQSSGDTRKEFIDSLKTVLNNLEINVFSVQENQSIEIEELRNIVRALRPERKLYIKTQAANELRKTLNNVVGDEDVEMRDATNQERSRPQDVPTYDAFQSDVRLKALNEEVSFLRSEYLRMNKRLTATEQAWVSQKRGFDDNIKRNDDLNSRLSKTEHLFNKTKKKLEKTSEELESVKNVRRKYDSASNELAEVLRTVGVNTQSGLNKNIEKLKEYLNKTRECEKLNEELVTLIEQINNFIRSDRSSNLLDQIQTHVNDTITDGRTKKACLDLLGILGNVLTLENELRKKIEDLTGEIADCTNNLKIDEEKCAQLQNRMVDAEKNIEHWKTLYDQARNEAQQSQTEKSALQSITNALQHTNAMLNQTIEQNNRELKTFRTKDIETQQMIEEVVTENVSRPSLDRKTSVNTIESNQTGASLDWENENGWSNDLLQQPLAFDDQLNNYESNQKVQDLERRLDVLNFQNLQLEAEKTALLENINEYQRSINELTMQLQLHETKLSEVMSEKESCLNRLESVGDLSDKIESVKKQLLDERSLKLKASEILIEIQELHDSLKKVGKIDDPTSELVLKLLQNLNETNSRSEELIESREASSRKSSLSSTTNDENETKAGTSGIRAKKNKSSSSKTKPTNKENNDMDCTIINTKRNRKDANLDDEEPSINTKRVVQTVDNYETQTTSSEVPPITEFELAPSSTEVSCKIQPEVSSSQIVQEQDRDRYFRQQRSKPPEVKCRTKVKKTDLRSRSLERRRGKVYDEDESYGNYTDPPSIPNTPGNSINDYIAGGSSPSPSYTSDANPSVNADIIEIVPASPDEGSTCNSLPPTPGKDL